MKTVFEVNTDIKGKKSITINKEHEYDIGEALVDFIESDLTIIMGIVDEICKTNELNLTAFNKKIKYLLHTDIPPYFVIYAPDIFMRGNPVLPMPKKPLEDIQEDTIIKFRDEILKIKSIQNEFKEMIDFCLDVDNETFYGLEPIKRLYIYNRMRSDYTEYLFSLEDALSVYFSPKVDSPPLDLKFRPSKTYNINKMVESMRKIPCELTEYIAVDSISQACYFEFINMIKNNILVRKCRYCGKYFVLTNRIDAEFCNRIPEGSVKSCKEIGPIKRYMEKVKANPAKELYQKAYKNNNRLLNLKKISHESYDSWKKEALEKMKNVNESIKENQNDKERLLDEFEKWLKSPVK